jgi:DNA polymerase-3 subunit epsilon
MISSNNAMVPKLFFIDVEVDSVPRERGEPLQSITQIAVCDPSRPEKERYFVAHVIPNKQLRKKNAGSVNTQSTNGPTQFKFKHLWKDLTQWVNSRLDGNRQALFMGHNIYKHDWPIISNECTRIGESVPKFWKTFDTLYLAGTLYGKGGNSQVELCHRLGVEVLKAHEALNDVKMLEGVFKAMVGNAKIEKVLKAALTPIEDHPVVAVANVIRKFVEPILVFYDFETTGLFPDKNHPDRGNPRAVELAAFIPSINKSWGSLIDPNMPIPEEAMGIHGITNEMVQGKPSFKAAWLSFEDFINKEIGSTANKIVVLCGHNVWGYDDKVYQAECERTNLPKKTWKTFDTLALARVMCKGGKRISHKLQDWRTRLNIAENQAHRAGGDVIVNAQVWAKWVEGIPQKDLNKAIASGHPAKGVALLIQEKGTFRPSDYTQDPKAKVEDLGTNSFKREREAVEVAQPQSPKMKKNKAEVVETKQALASVARILDLDEVKQPVAVVHAPVKAAVVDENGLKPMEIDDGEGIELVFNSKMEIVKY